MNPPPPFRGTGVSDKNPDLASSKASAGPAHSAGPTIREPFGPHFSDFSDFLVNYSPLKKQAKFRLHPKTPKISKIRPPERPRPRFWMILMPFGLHFPSNCATRRTLLNRNKHGARAQFYHLRTSHFSIKFPSKIPCFFHTPLLDFF